jgi:ABC-type uncharacterized transport system permease subunit
VTAKLKLNRVFRLKTLLGIFSPVVAVVMAFVVGAVIILVFIKSFALAEKSFAGLAEKGVPALVLNSLQPLKGIEYPDRSEFEKEVRSAIGDPNYARYGRVIKKQALIRQNPLTVYEAIFTAALENRDGWGNVIYRATPLIFTGLAVALAFQCGLFNIGGEGQMVMGGFALTWIGFTFARLPAFLLIPLCILGGAAAGAVWGGIPGYLKARRGVHEVVTTIMLNWIAVAFTQYLTMAYKPAGSWIPQTFEIAKSIQLSRLARYLNPIGIDFPKSNLLNTSVFVAILTVVFAAYLLRRTKIGYETGRRQPGDGIPASLPLRRVRGPGI